ncbi:hypothetical protein KEM48_006785 [Puccinia striiformis f. sp. tritici PST-130]|nr:hypothetical protein KEM48_006785 [Puccinia striiformis f. sp. tritici PST-130]
MSMLKSELWSNVVHYRLTYNVRLLGLESGNTDQEALGYNQWLLSVGEATAQVKFQEEINLPFGSVFVHRSESFLRSKVIDFVYGELIRYNEVNDEGSLAMFYMSRAILSPLNKSVNLLNEQCLNKLPVPTHLPHDKFQPDKNNSSSLIERISLSLPNNNSVEKKY